MIEPPAHTDLGEDEDDPVLSPRLSDLVGLLRRDVELKAEENVDLRNRNRILARALLFLGLATLVGFGSIVVQIALDNQGRAGIRQIIRNIEEQTSPEAQARQNQVLEDTIVRVDCNVRDALQDALDALGDEILEDGVVTIRCTEGTAPGVQPGD